MPIVYDRDGCFYRMEPAGYAAKTGEAVFPDVVTPVQLAAVFPGYADAIKNPDPFK